MVISVKRNSNFVKNVSRVISGQSWLELLINTKEHLLVGEFMPIFNTFARLFTK